MPNYILLKKGVGNRESGAVRPVANLILNAESAPRESGVGVRKLTVPDNYENRFNSIIVIISYLHTPHTSLSFPHFPHSPLSPHSPLFPDSRFPIPDSRFPIPDSLFPVPYSLLPIPCSLLSLI
ncbi:MAG: hypothetical protein F6K26_43000 [Moorea sp. SIO2I5]|nr:hypothetical protein [Moorena sp. SIO2I5]